MTQSTHRPTDTGADDEDRLNEEFHTLLRTAAEKREGRARIQSTEDAAAARRESADLLALARSQAHGRQNRMPPARACAMLGVPGPL